MSKGERFVRTVFWLGAGLDVIAIVPLLWPKFFLASFAIDASTLGTAGRFAGYMAAALMAGWTGLLAWGVHNPLERRGVLLLTAAPVMVGLIGSSLYLGAIAPSGFVSVVPMLVLQSVVLVLMVSAWLIAARESERPRS